MNNHKIVFNDCLKVYTRDQDKALSPEETLERFYKKIGNFTTRILSEVKRIDNGRLDHPPEALRGALGDVAATTVSVMMDQSMQTALTRSYFGTQFLGYEFNMVAIPDDVGIGKDPLAFDPKQMRAAFDAGRSMAKQANPWKSTPPNQGDIPSWAMDTIKAGFGKHNSQ